MAELSVALAIEASVGQYCLEIVGALRRPRSSVLGNYRTCVIDSHCGTSQFEPGNVNEMLEADGMSRVTVGSQEVAVEE